MVTTLKKIYFIIKCENCQKEEMIEKDFKLYNRAQAARKIGWSFGKDQKTYCPTCRSKNWNDCYQAIGRTKELRIKIEKNH